MTEIKNKLISIFKNLHFDLKSHTYKVDGVLHSSVSGLIKDFHRPFDRYGKSLSVSRREGITQEELLMQWDGKRDYACKFGTEVHNFAEEYVNNEFTYLQNGEEISGHHEAVLKFWKELPEFIVPLILEFRMYHPIYKYAGTPDIILLDVRDNSLILADYKTNKSLFKNYKNETLINGFEFLLNNNYNKYQLQLSFYQILLAQAGYKISDRLIIWLKPDGNYELFTAVDYTEQLTNYLKNRLCQQ